MKQVVKEHLAQRLAHVVARLSRGAVVLIEPAAARLARALRTEGLDRVVRLEGAHELENTAPGSARTVVLMEALPADDEAAAAVLQLAWSRVRPGGRLVLITANRKACDVPGARKRRELQHLLEVLARPRLAVDQPYRWLLMHVKKPRGEVDFLPPTVVERYNSIAALCRGSVLELGCGPGHLAAAIAARGHAVVGMDINHSKVRQARERYTGITFFQGDAATLDMGNEKFDTVVIAEVLEHVSDQLGDRILAAAVRALREGGRMIVSVPNEKSIPHPNHVRTFDVHSLRILLRRYGQPRQIIDQPYKWLLMYVDLSD